MIAYTFRPTDGRHYHVDGPNGGATGCNLAADHWDYVQELPGGPFLSPEQDDRLPAGVLAVVTGAPPVPDGGWRLGEEVVVREPCYAGPQWIYKRLRLVAGDPNGGSFSPVGRVAYGQRMY